jgi:hypothetical protein
MTRQGYTQLQDIDTRMTWLRRVAERMGLDATAHKDRVRMYDFALGALCAKLTADRSLEPIQVDEVVLTDPEPWDRELSHYEYQYSQELYPEIAGNFVPVLAVLMRDADTDNMERLAREFPVIAKMLQDRYNAPGGVLPEVDGYTAEEWYERQQEDDDG